MGYDDRKEDIVIANKKQSTSALGDLLGPGIKQIGAALAAFLVFPIVARMLSKEELGAWSLIAAAAFMLGLADMGLTTAVQRAAVSDDHGRARRTFSLALLVIVLTIPFITLLAYFTALNFSEVSPALRNDAKNAALVAFGAGAIAAFNLPFQGYTYARGGAADIAGARAASAFLQAALVAVGFALMRSLIIPAAALLVANLVEITITIRAARRFDPELPLFPRWPTDRGEAIKALRDGAAQLAINASVVTALRVDLFVLQWATTQANLKGGMGERKAVEDALRVVGLYGLAGKAIEQAYLLAKQANTALMRRLGNPEERAAAMRIGTGVFGGIIAAGMMALAFNGQTFLVLVLGDKALGGIVATVLLVLALASIVLATYEVAGSLVMLGSVNAWSCAIPIVTGSLVNLVISISFAPKYGVWAVAGSTLVGNCITAVLMWRQVGKLLSWGIKDRIQVLLPLIASLGVAFSIAYPLRELSQSTWWLSLGICIIVSAGGIGIMALLLRRMIVRARSGEFNVA